jgi:hypothetical protein
MVGNVILGNADDLRCLGKEAGQVEFMLSLKLGESPN